MSGGPPDHGYNYYPASVYTQGFSDPWQTTHPAAYNPINILSGVQGQPQFDMNSGASTGLYQPTHAFGWDLANNASSFQQMGNDFSGTWNGNSQNYMRPSGENFIQQNGYETQNTEYTSEGDIDKSVNERMNAMHLGNGDSVNEIKSTESNSAGTTNSMNSDAANTSSSGANTANTSKPKTWAKIAQQTPKSYDTPKPKSIPKQVSPPKRDKQGYGSRSAYGGPNVNIGYHRGGYQGNQWNQENFNYYPGTNYIRNKKQMAVISPYNSQSNFGYQSNFQNYNHPQYYDRPVGGFQPYNRSPHIQQNMNYPQKVISNENKKDCEVLAKLKKENDYNPKSFEFEETARFFVIKSFSEDDIHRSIKQSVWCSTQLGNNKLNQAYLEREGKGPIYLLFSVNMSRHFCGIAQMVSPVDFEGQADWLHSTRYKGKFDVKWIYVKDVPNSVLKHIHLENNENKPVTNSRDCQEIPLQKGIEAAKLIADFSHKTSIFNDFDHYEDKEKHGGLENTNGFDGNQQKNTFNDSGPVKGSGGFHQNKKGYNKNRNFNTRNSVAADNDS